MTIKTMFSTTDGQMFDTRREANAHQRSLDASGMLENMLTQLFSVNGYGDDTTRDKAIAEMLCQHADDVISLLKGKPVSNPELDEAALEDDIRAQDDATADDAVVLNDGEQAA